MIHGEVTADREATIDVYLLRDDGGTIRLTTVIDTGFTEYLTLPRAVVEAQLLPFDHWTWLGLADGSAVPVEVYRASVAWDEQPRTIPVHAVEGGPLIGMALLYGSEVWLEVVDGGAVTIRAL